MKPTLDIPLHVKALGTREFEGHGSVFGNVDLGGDIVMPGAFAKSIAEHQGAGMLPQMFWMHAMDQVPGKWVEMREDDRGLYVKGVLADTQLGNEMRTLLNMKAVRGLSIGYVPNDVAYDKEGNRLLKEIDLWEVSLVSLAMNPLARVEGAKSRLSRDGEYVPTEREFERALRDVGCSKTVSRILIAKIFDDGPGGMPGPRWDAGDVEEEAVAKALHALDSITGSMIGAALRR
jgi:HK97 family phage prohead protease